jgi:hypothetical protein
METGPKENMKKTDKEKPLPKPPTTVFGRRKRSEQEDQTTLMADRIAAAMSEGKLEEFLQREMPDSEYARNLATMMMGMTGMIPAGDTVVSSNTPENKDESLLSENANLEQTPSVREMPEDVKTAVQGGDVRELMDLLRREHQKRRPGVETQPADEVPESQPVDQPTIDKELIDALIRIATDNSVTIDWITLRAIKLYVQEYQKTGRL